MHFGELADSELHIRPLHDGAARIRAGPCARRSQGGHGAITAATHFLAIALGLSSSLLIISYDPYCGSTLRSPQAIIHYHGPQ